MAKHPIPTVEQLRQLLRYDPESGILYWRERGPEWFVDGYRTAQGEANNWNVSYAGKRAGSAFANGYIYLSIMHKKLLAHRIVWTMAHGEWPKIIDHIDGNPLNNLLPNLRSVSQSVNMRNASMWSHNTSGHLGVTWLTRECRWRAYIKVSGRTVLLGTYVDKAMAISARQAAEMKYNFLPGHGRAGRT